MNRVAISGNLLRDPVIHTAKSGKAVMYLMVANDGRKLDINSGKWSDYTNYFNCVMFGERSQSIARVLAKGSKVSVIGKLRERYQKDDGRGSIEIVIDDIEFASPRDRAALASSKPYLDCIYGDIPF